MDKKATGKKTLMSGAVAKAANFASKNDQPVRAKAKQAILQELNNQLQVKAQKMRIVGQQKLIPEVDQGLKELRDDMTYEDEPDFSMQLQGFG